MVNNRLDLRIESVCGKMCIRDRTSLDLLGLFFSCVLFFHEALQLQTQICLSLIHISASLYITFR